MTLHDAEASLERAIEWLSANQEPHGGWDGHISSESVITAWVTYGLILSGQRESRTVERSLAWLIANQNDDGSWGGSRGQLGYPGATQLVSGVLRAAGTPDSAEVLVRARRYLGDGQEHTAMLTQLFSAIESGDPSHVKLPIPKLAFEVAIRRPELRKLARQVPRYVSEMLFALGLVAFSAGPSRRGAAHRRLTRTLEEMWLRQGRWVVCGPVLAAFSRYGASPSSDIVRRAIKWAEEGQAPDGGWSWTPGGQFLDSTLPMMAMERSGITPDLPMMRRAKDWIFRNRTPEHMWGTYKASVPDADDTSSAVLGLLAAGEPKSSSAIREGVRFLKHDQRYNGSWGYPDGRFQCNHAEETGIAVLALVSAGEAVTSSAVSKGISWLNNHQMPDGSWPGRWYTQRSAPVFRAVTALRAAGTPPTSCVLLLAADFLRRLQDDKGSFGGVDDTAYSVATLLQLAGPDDLAVQRGVAWLIKAQGKNGAWTPGYNGYFADPFGSWTFNYTDRMWCMSHCVWAVGTYVQALRSRAQSVHRGRAQSKEGSTFAS